MTQDFLKGIKPDPGNLVSPYIYESILAEHYGWSLEDIRNLELKDFYAHIRICLTKDMMDKEFNALLSGAKPADGSKKKFDKNKAMDGVPNKMQQKGTVRETRTEKAMSFSSQVKPVKITKT